MKTLLVFLFTASLQACISSTPPLDRTEPIWEPQSNIQEGLKKAYFALFLVCRSDIRERSGSF
jgi:hypothetical protein